MPENVFRRALLTLAFLCGAVLLVVRFQTAIHRGPVDYDEGIYLDEAKSLVFAIEHVPGLIAKSYTLQEMRRDVRAMGGLFPPSTGKQTHMAVLTLAGLFTHHLAILPGLISLISFVIATLVFYRCGRLLSLDFETAAATALVFFASPVCGYYSVLGFTNPMTAMFILLAVLFYLEDRWPLAAGSLGLALTTHWGSMASVVLMLGAILIDRLFLRSWPRNGKVPALGKMIAAFAAPAFFWEIVTRLFKPFVNHAEFGQIVYRTYLEQIFHQFVIAKPTYSYTDALTLNFSMLGSLAAYEGIAVMALLGVTHWIALANFQGLQAKKRVLLALSVVITLAWMFNPGTMVARAVLFILPFSYVALCAGLPEITRRLGRNHQGVPIFLTLLVMWQTPRAYRTNALLDSPYRQSLSYLQTKGYAGDVIDLHAPTIWQYYLNRQMQLSTVLGNDDLFFTAIRDSFAVTQAAAIPYLKTDHDYVVTGPRVQALLAKLNARPADAAWPIRYGVLPMSRFESTSPDDPHPKPRTMLELRWIARTDLIK